LGVARAAGAVQPAGVAVNVIAQAQATFFLAKYIVHDIIVRDRTIFNEGR